RCSATSRRTAPTWPARWSPRATRTSRRSSPPWASRKRRSPRSRSAFSRRVPRAKLRASRRVSPKRPDGRPLRGPRRPAATAAAPPAKKINHVIDTFVHLVAERPEFFTVYFQEKGHLGREHLRTVTKTERRIVDTVRKIYRDGAAEGSFRKLDPTATAFGLLGLCFWV